MKKLNKHRKEKFIIYYNNEYIDVLIGKEILEDIGYKYSAEEAFADETYKDGWIYEITISNIVFNSENHDYRTEYWTEFDIIKIVPLRYISKFVKTQSEIVALDLQERKDYQIEIQKLVQAQNKDGLKWDLCKMWSGLGIHTVQGESFRMYEIKHSFKDDSLTWENLNFIREECLKFFDIKPEKSEEFSGDLPF